MTKPPILMMLVGVPASGKSTYIKNKLANEANTVVVSTDDYIEQAAAAAGTTYDAIFSKVVGVATKAMKSAVRDAVANNQNIIWDQTNTTAKSRASKLAMIPDSYRKVAVFFHTPDPEELQKRLGQRSGKTIPAHVVANMISGLEPPTKSEGFDEIIEVK